MELSVSRIEIKGQLMFTGIVRDITERQKVDRMKNEFVSTVSHELRTPLNVIIGYSNSMLNMPKMFQNTSLSEAHKPFMQLIEGDLFRDFPALRFIIPHGGGAVPYHWGRYRGLADMLKKPDLSGHLMNNVYFDTCVYHQPGINLLADVIANNNILFGSEMVGAVRGIDPTTGHYFDDTKRYVDALDISEAERHAIFEGNARRVFPRLDSQLKARGQ